MQLNNGGPPKQPLIDLCGSDPPPAQRSQSRLINGYSEKFAGLMNELPHATTLLSGWKIIQPFSFSSSASKPFHFTSLFGNNCSMDCPLAASCYTVRGVTGKSILYITPISGQKPISAFTTPTISSQVMFQGIGIFTIPQGPLLVPLRAEVLSKAGGGETRKGTSIPRMQTS